MKPRRAIFEDKVNDAIARGARLLFGNVRKGALYSPTVLDRVHPDMPVVKTETFGPVSPVIRFKFDRRGHSHLKLHRLWPVIGRLHQPPRLHHALCHGAERGQRQRARSAGLSARAHALRRNQGFRHRRQGGRAGGHEVLYQRQDLLAALVIRALVPSALAKHALPAHSIAPIRRRAARTRQPQSRALRLDRIASSEPARVMLSPVNPANLSVYSGGPALSCGRAASVIKLQ